MGITTIIQGAPLGLAAAVALSCAATAPSAPQPDAVRPDATYTVRIDVDPVEEVAHMRATLTGLGGHAIDLAFVERYAFVTLPPSLVGDFRFYAADGRAGALQTTDGFQFGDVPTGDSIELEWSIRLNARSAPEVISASDHYEQSYVDGRHGMLFTAGLVPMPSVDLGRCEVRFTGAFEGTAKAPWPSEDAPGGEQVFTPSARSLGDDIVLIGDAWETVDANAGGMTATFAMSPGNERLLPLVNELLVPIVEEEVRLFGAAPRERYLFIFGPSGGQPGLGGSPKSGAITMYASEKLDARQLKGGIGHLVAHEFHHTFARAAFAAKDEIRFFSEGFTDYYAYLVPWRLGFMKDASFHRMLERKLSEGAAALDGYGRSLAEAGGPEFFAGREAYDACYSAGLALAFWTDVGLRRAENPTTLDAVMRELHASWSASIASGEAHEAGLSGITKILRDHLGKSTVAAFTAAVTTAEELSWEALFDEVGVPIDRIDTEGAPAEYRVPPAVLDLLRAGT